MKALRLLLGCGIVLIVIAYIASPHVRQVLLKQQLVNALHERNEKEFFVLGENIKSLDTLDQQEVMLLACAKGQAEVVRWIHGAGVSLSFADDDGFTPLLEAATSNEPELVLYLLTFGADVDHKDKFGYKALDCCISANRRNSVETARLLLKAGAKPFDGMSDPEPFKSAVRIGNTNMIALLLDHMPDVAFSLEDQQEVFSWCSEEHNDSWNFLSKYFANPK